MTSRRHITTALAFVAALTACAQQPMQPADAVPVGQASAPVPAQPHASAPAAESAAAAAPQGDANEAPQAKARTMAGNDQVIAPTQPVPAVTGTPMSFNFEEAPVAEVVRAILGDVLKQPYVLHPPLAGTVTLSSRNPIAPDQALFLLESALQANGLLMVRDARGTYHVGRADALRNIGAAVRQVGNGAPLAPGYGAIVVPLQYIGANEMATILRPLAPPEAIVRVDTVRNLLVLVGTRSQAEGWLDLVHTFDVNLLKGMSVGLFPLKHASIREVEAALRLVSGQPQPAAGAATGAATAATAPGARTQAGTGAAAAAAAALGEANPLFGALRVMPIERLNAILVVTPRAAYLEEARRWIEKFDQPGNGGGEASLHIYKVQNGSAQHLASVLSGIFGTGQPAAAPVANSGVAPGLGSGMATSFGQQQPLGGSTGYGSAGYGGSGGFNAPLGANAGRSGLGGFGAAPRPGQNAGQGAVATELGGIRVMPDTQNNSILVWSTGVEFGKIEATLKRLDVPPTQVLIEASIIEVTLSDDLKYGLQWAFSDTHRRGPGTGVVGALATGATGGFSYTLKDTLGNMRVTLNALAAKSLIKVISSPSLMVLDNQVATIAVGTQQPVRTGETTNPSIVGNQTTTTYQYKDTGVQLQVQPSVNSGDLVTMDIMQSVTDVGDEDTVTGQRAFLQRQISSKVAVRSGEAIVLGGLIKDNATSGRSGVPLLSSIPIVGGLFGTTATTSGRTELLVVITPRVVRTDPEIRQASEELRERLKGLKLMELQGREPAAQP
ncbi:MAG: type II secretion system secretin GspD [Comamonas sp.]|nr:type II secretion system secretin GspD [Comamonas sp.]